MQPNGQSGAPSSVSGTLPGRHRAQLKQVSLAIVKGEEPGTPRASPRYHTPPAVSDGSRAIQSMLLTAQSEAPGGNWVGFVGQADAVKPILGIPDDRDVLVIEPVGHPTNPGGKGPKARKPFDEVVYGERWG